MYFNTHMSNYLLYFKTHKKGRSIVSYRINIHNKNKGMTISHTIVKINPGFNYLASFEAIVATCFPRKRAPLRSASEG